MGRDNSFRPKMAGRASLCWRGIRRLNPRFGLQQIATAEMVNKAR